MKGKLLAVALVAVLAVLVLPSAFASRTGSMMLLAVSEIGDGVYKGSVADLSLEIREGTGRIFVNTFPISKLDTQISMRFAKQVACKHTGKDCSRYDFIYTLTAQSGIVGGPSAGAAAAVLAVSVLDGIPLKKDIAITGTINSGELIGPVGGLKSKIDVAATSGIRKVLIPRGESINEENDSEHIDIDEYSKELGIEIVEIATLDDALYYFTGIQPKPAEARLIVDDEYKEVMKSISLMLCNRSAYLQGEYLLAKPRNRIDEKVLEFEKSAINSTEKAREAFGSGDYYTSASYCFRANINFKYLQNYAMNLSSKELKELADSLKEDIEEAEKSVSAREIRTMNDLQAYMITKERIEEARERREDALDEINNTNDAAYWLAFANERLYSVYSWGFYFGTGKNVFKLDNETLRDSCIIKVSEAEERFQYVNFYFPDTLSGTRKDIDRAKEEMGNGDYIMCLYTASRAKAQANVVMSAIGVEEEMLNGIVELKIGAAEQTIIGQQEMGVFPIMGYSYLEYAKSLSGDDLSSAMIYAEYALELSNFDFYFEKEAGFELPRLEPRLILALAVGICIGFLIGMKLKTPSKSGKRKNSRK